MRINARELVTTARTLFEIADRHDNVMIRVILYSIVVEALAASIVLTLGSRRSEKKARLSLKRLISTALNLLSKHGFVTGDDASRLRRVLNELRCVRNAFLHPWLVSGEHCGRVDIEEYRRAILVLFDLVNRVVGGSEIPAHSSQFQRRAPSS